MLGATFSLHATHHQTVQRKERIASHQSVRHSRNATVAGNCAVNKLAISHRGHHNKIASAENDTHFHISYNARKLLAKSCAQLSKHMFDA